MKAVSEKSSGSKVDARTVSKQRKQTNCMCVQQKEAINGSKQWKQSVVGAEWIVGASREKSENQ